jgi:hypothetical protein
MLALWWVVLRELTTNQKGAVAEAAIAKAAFEPGIEVYRPAIEGGRDAFVAYCAARDRCYFVPFEAVGASPQINLRVSPPRNNQRLRIRNANDFDFAARLEELIPGP